MIMIMNKKGNGFTKKIGDRARAVRLGFISFLLLLAGRLFFSIGEQMRNG